MAATHCDICGYKFKTIQKLEEHYGDGFEKYKEYVTYPDPTDPNPAHLVRNYICDKCYQDIGNVIRNKLIKDGEKFVKDLPSRIEKERKNFELAVQKLEEESKEVESICKNLNNINYLFELSNDELKMIDKHEYKPFRTYYLNSAIRLERERVNREFSVDKWIKLFGIEVVKLAKGRMYSDIVNVEEFKSLLQECVLKDYSYQDMNRLLKKIDDYIANT